RPDLTGAIKEGGRFASESQGRLRLRQWLMGFETALAVALLIGAGLLIKSFWVLKHVRLGFNPKHVLTTGVTPPEGRSGTEQVGQRKSLESSETSGTRDPKLTPTSRCTFR